MSQGRKPIITGGKLPQFRSVALVAVGSNYPSVSGDARETIRKGITAVQTDRTMIRAVSRYYRTPAFPPGNGPDFVNAALAVETDFGPQEFLLLLHSVEAAMGRERRERWAPRTLDLDLIAMDEIVLPDAQTHKTWRRMSLEAQMSTTPDTLILPHPRLQERAFVLVPLADVAADWVHPVLGRSVSQMLDALPESDRGEVRPIE
ncbi:2-amino-4-hydroxy-6-hydroxymethyldihydropteridine diphosphokinase [Roseobacter sp. S98]|uniref:2-amino-4-hydroxy-6- hydroxymethyldihydropteridine diphosphokinase n=1 Tax=Roseobacter algicola (ex Choi et al. 2025) (nom. illeg.) TaxID=3092138 RepID=UPI0035C742B7